MEISTTVRMHVKSVQRKETAGLLYVAYRSLSYDVDSTDGVPTRQPSGAIQVASRREYDTNSYSQRPRPLPPQSQTECISRPVNQPCQPLGCSAWQPGFPPTVCSPGPQWRRFCPSTVSVSTSARRQPCTQSVLLRCAQQVSPC
jgi:hypothetical protein